MRLPISLLVLTVVITCRGDEVETESTEQEDVRPQPPAIQPSNDGNAEEDLQNPPPPPVKDGLLERKKRFTEANNQLWPNKEIPYYFNSATFGSSAAGQKHEAEVSMKYFEERTCVKYREINATQHTSGTVPHAQYAIKGYGCSSFLGFKNNVNGQPIQCCSRGYCLHELLHLIGLVHEHQHPERNKYVRVNWQEIQPGGYHNYYRYDASAVSNAEGYIISSAAHYSAWGFSKSHLPTIQVLDDDLSITSSYFYPLKEVNEMYNCKEDNCQSFTTSCSHDGYVAKVKGSCTCVCPDGLNPADGCNSLESGTNSFAWPQGSYAFIAAEGGCPSGFSLGYRTQWSEGWSWYVEPVIPFAGNQDRYKFDYEFCVSNNNFASSTNTWGSGNYCILRAGGTCPEGFEEGTVQFDDTITSASRNNTASGDLPDGVFGQDTKLEFCCRSDGFDHAPLEIPNTDPITLYSISQSSCQPVKNMMHRIFYYTFDNGPSSINSRTGSLPKNYWYGSTHTVLFYACHYTPITRDCGGIFELSETQTTVSIQTPNYPNNYNDGEECMWIVKAPENDNILLNFEDFALENSGTYCPDSVEVRPVDIASPNRRFCTQDGRSWRSHKNTMTIVFRSSAATSQRGFNATFSLLKAEDSCFQAADDGSSYRGTVNFTRDSTPCLPWSEVRNCRHNDMNPMDGDDDLRNNYCRNPGDGRIPWCYTEKTTCARQYCDVCGKERLFDKVSDCAQLQSSVPDFCNSDDRASSYCAKTCSGTTVSSIVANRLSNTSCSAPTAPGDGVTSDQIKTSYSVGEKMTYTCNTNTESSVTITCTSTGTWTNAISACKTCNDGWYVYKGVCYKAFSNVKQWSQARDACTALGGKMFQPKEDGAINFVNQIRQRHANYWVGASDLAQEGTWRWLDGSLVTAGQNKFFNGVGRNTTGWNDCVYMGGILSNSIWGDVYCSSNYYLFMYICEKPTNDLNVPCRNKVSDCEERLSESAEFCSTYYAQEKCTATCGLNGCQDTCPTGETESEEQCYKYINEAKIFLDARAQCKGLGYQVAGSKTDAERGVIDSLRTNMVWIGANDEATEDQFVWEDGTPVPENRKLWANGEPSNTYSAEDCITYNGAVWYDVYCFYYFKYPFVCVRNVRPRCDISSLPSNSTQDRNGTSMPAGQVIKYTCNDGYFLESGNLERGCLWSGQLTGSPPVCAQATQANVLTVVNSDSGLIHRGGNIPNFVNGLFVSSERFFIPRAGEIVQWRYYSDNSGPVALLVLRPNGTDFKLVDYNYITTEANGRSAYFKVPTGDRIAVQKGDRIGVWFQTSQTISATVYSSGDISAHPEIYTRRSVLSPSSTTSLTAGETYEFYTSNMAVAAAFSLQAVIGPAS